MYSYSTFRSGEDIEIGDVVSYIFKSTLIVIRSNITNVNYALPIGVATHSAKCGQLIAVQTEGIALLNRFASFEPGKPVFLSYSSGSLSHFPRVENGVVQNYSVGLAVSSDAIKFSPTLYTYTVPVPEKREVFFDPIVPAAKPKPESRIRKVKWT